VAARAVILVVGAGLAGLSHARDPRAEDAAVARSGLRSSDLTAVFHADGKTCVVAAGRMDRASIAATRRFDGAPTVAGLSTSRAADDLRTLFADVDAHFGPAPYDAVVAVPAGLSVSERLALGKNLGSGARRARLVIATELAVLGHQHHRAASATPAPPARYVAIDVTAAHVSATLAEAAEGVVESVASVGFPIEPRGDAVAARAAAVRNAWEWAMTHKEPLARAPTRVVVSEGAGATGVAASLEGLARARSVALEKDDDVVLKGLFVQVGIFAGAAAFKEDLLLTATPNTSFGFILSRDLVSPTRSDATFGRAVPQLRVSDPPVGLLGASPIALEEKGPTVPAGRYIELVRPFTTIPARASGVVPLGAGATRLTPVEFTGRAIVVLPGDPIDLVSDRPESTYEVTFDLDADLSIDVRVTMTTEVGRRRYGHRPRR